MNHVSLRNILEYRELLRAGHSSDEIKRKILAPIAEEQAEELFQEAAPLVAALAERVEEMRRRESATLCEVETIDIGSAAKKALQGFQVTGDQLAAAERALSLLVADAREEQESLHLCIEKTQQKFKELQQQLRNTPAEPKGVDSKKLAERGADFCRYVGAKREDL